MRRIFLILMVFTVIFAAAGYTFAHGHHGGGWGNHNSYMRGNYMQNMPVQQNQNFMRGQQTRNPQNPGPFCPFNNYNTQQPVK